MERLLVLEFSKDQVEGVGFVRLRGVLNDQVEGDDLVLDIIELFLKDGVRHIIMDWFEVHLSGLWPSRVMSWLLPIKSAGGSLRLIRVAAPANKKLHDQRHVLSLRVYESNESALEALRKKQA